MADELDLDAVEMIHAGSLDPLHELLIAELRACRAQRASAERALAERALVLSEECWNNLWGPFLEVSYRANTAEARAERAEQTVALYVRHFPELLSRAERAEAEVEYLTAMYRADIDEARRERDTAIHNGTAAQLRAERAEAKATDFEGRYETSHASRMWAEECLRNAEARIAAALDLIDADSPNGWGLVRRALTGDDR